MDGLKLAQLSDIFAGMGQSAATYNPAQRTMMDYLQGNAQSAIQAEAQKKAEKKAKKKQSSGIGSLLGGAAAVAAAPFTGGASLAYVPAAMAGGSAVESATKGDMPGAINNTLAGVGAGYGAYKADTTPVSATGNAISSVAKMATPTATPTVGSPSMTGMPDLSSMRTSDSMAAPVSHASITPPSPQPNMNKIYGGPAQMMAASRIQSMKPWELRRAINSGDISSMDMANHIAAYGASPKLVRGMPLSMRQDMRNQGYNLPNAYGGWM